MLSRFRRSARTGLPEQVSEAAAPTALSNDEIIAATYRIYLGRDPDAEGLRAYRRALAEGLSLADFVRALTSSEEFLRAGGIESVAQRLGVARPSGEHPLARWPWIYTAKYMPYFSQRSLFRPAAMILETVNICNNACVICSYPVHTRPKRTMSLDLFRRAVDQYAAVGGGHLSMTPMLGEIFVDKLLPERLEILASIAAVTSLSATTNAVMARRYGDERLRSILARFDRLYISVYGLDRDEYHRMTRKDEFALMEQQVHRILQLARPGAVVFGLRNLKTRTQEEMRNWAERISAQAGVPTVPIASATTEYHRWGGLDLGELPEDARWAAPRQNSTQCLIPLSALQVLADGTISFCSCADFDGNPGLTLGNIATDDLAEVLRSERYAALWNWEAKGVPDFCKSCGFHKPMEAAKDRDWDPSDPVSFIGG